MKVQILLLAAGLSFGMMACNDNATTADESKKDSSVTVTSTENTPVNNNVGVDVPQPTRTAFETKYPKATNVKWSRYEPETGVTPDPADWNYKLDTSDYVVNFNLDGEDYYAWYDDGAWVRATSPVKDHSKLPAAVNEAIRSQYAGYDITEVDKENDKDRTTYEVDLKKGDDKMKVHFDENGKVVKAKGRVDGKKVKEKEEDKH
jgi:Putative beta-lactamase-inhibitor-like, PepSY-like